MADVGLKIVVGADISAVTDGMKVAANNVAQFGDVAEKTFSDVATKVGVAANSFEHAFDEIAASNAAMAKINASIEAAGDAAIQTGAKFDTLGGRLPLQDFNVFKKSVDQFKKDIASGFKFNFPPNPIPPSFPDALNKTKIGANQAANALTNVGRVAQDLPFGFIGIQNNLNPLLESFQRLRAETGSNKAALSALGQSLIGPAGIGIALSVVSAAFVIFQNGIAGFNSKTKEAKDKTEEFLKTLKSVGEVTAAATGSQAGDIAQVQALASVITNTNNAYSERKRALEELKQVNKSYFGDLKLEESQMGVLTARVNEYTQAIVAQAVLKGFTDEISRVSVELAKQDRILRNNADEVNRLRAALEFTKQSETSLTGEDRISQKYVKTKSALEDANGAFKAQFDVVGKLRSNLNDLQGSIDGAVKETLKFRDLNDPQKQKAVNDGLAKQLNLIEKIRDAQKEFQGKLFDLKDIDEATNKLTQLETQVGNLKLQIAVRDAKKAGLPAAEIEKLKDAINADTQKRLNEAFEKEALLLEFNAKLKTKSIQLLDVFDISGRVFTFKEKITVALDGSNIEVQKIPVDVTDLQGKIAKATGLDKKITIRPQFEIDKDLFGRSFADAQERLRQQIAGLKEILFNGVVNGMQDVASALGEAFANIISGETVGSSFAKAAKSLLNIVGGILQQMGAQIIITSKAVAVLKKALNNLFGPGGEAAGLAAGLLLVATGSILKNIKFDGPKFATGGIVSSPLIGQIGEANRPEVIMPLDRLPQLFKQFGGDIGGGTQLIPIINNEGLYLAMKRGERSAGRKF